MTPREAAGAPSAAHCSHVNQATAVISSARDGTNLMRTLEVMAGRQAVRIFSRFEFRSFD